MSKYQESYDRLFEEYRDNHMGFGVRSDLDNIRSLINEHAKMKQGVSDMIEELKQDLSLWVSKDVLGDIVNRLQSLLDV